MGIEVNKCVVTAFQFAWVERILIVTRPAWFYWASFWPANLIFIYSALAHRQRLSLAIPVPGGCHRPAGGGLGDSPPRPHALAGALFFGGTLVPVLGFFNLYTFIYSFVADHYQYVACLGTIALVRMASPCC